MTCLGLPLLFLGVCFGSPVGVQKHKDMGSLLGGSPGLQGLSGELGKEKVPSEKGSGPGA